MEKSVPKQFVFMLHDTCSKLTILTIFFSYFTFNFTFEKLAINPRFFGTKAYFKFLKFSFEREKLDKLSGFAQQIFLWSIFPTLLKVWNNRKSSEENQTEKFSRKILDTPSPLRLISSLVRKSSVQKFFEEKRQFLACKLASLKI